MQTLGPVVFESDYLFVPFAQEVLGRWIKARLCLKQEDQNSYCKLRIVSGLMVMYQRLT